MLCIINISIKRQSFVYTQLNDQTVLFQTIQFSFNFSLNVNQFGNYLINNWRSPEKASRQSNVTHFIIIPLSNSTKWDCLCWRKVLALFLFLISFLYVHRFEGKTSKRCTFYLIHREDPIKCYHAGPEWTWEWWQWRGTPHSLSRQHYWSLTIRLTLVGGGLPLCRAAVSVFSPNRLSQKDEQNFLINKFKVLIIKSKNINHEFYKHTKIYQIPF